MVDSLNGMPFTNDDALTVLTCKSMHDFHKLQTKRTDIMGFHLYTFKTVKHIFHDTNQCSCCLSGVFDGKMAVGDFREG